jgi:hypothetical protein
LFIANERWIARSEGDIGHPIDISWTVTQQTPHKASAFAHGSSPTYPLGYLPRLHTAGWWCGKKPSSRIRAGAPSGSDQCLPFQPA